MIVEKTGNGTSENPYRPNLAKDAEYRVVKDLGDSVEVEVTSSVSVAKYKIEIILREDGEWQDVLDAVSQADERTQIAFEKASEWNRYSNAVEMIRKVLGKTHQQVDSIFREANKIEI